MRRLTTAVVALAIVCGNALVHAEEAKKLEVKVDEALVSVLRSQTGGDVILVLSSGQDIPGKLVMVGEKVVHLTRLRGMEYYDAVIALDEIVGIKVRVKTP
jgi:hypothetical protein